MWHPLQHQSHLRHQGALLFLVAGSYQYEVNVAVAGPTVKPLGRVVRGTLTRINPEEPAHALLWGLDEALADPRLSEDDKQGWVNRIRNVMYVFHKLSDHKEIIKKHINIREDDNGLQVNHADALGPLHDDRRPEEGAREGEGESHDGPALLVLQWVQVLRGFGKYRKHKLV